MRSWSSLLGEGTGASDDAILRRFVEASRRAEIIALVNSARGEAELGESVVSELCEAYEAEIAFVIAERTPGGSLELVGSAGLGGSAGAGARLLTDPLCAAALEAEGPAVHTGEDLLGLGVSTLAVAPFHGTAGGSAGGRAVVAVGRRYRQEFDSAERALLEAVTESVGHALERSWLGLERDRRAAQQAATARAAKLLNASLELDEVLDTLCREVRLALGADVVVVYLSGEDGLVAAAADGLDQPIAGHVPPGEMSLAATAFATDRPQLSSDYREEGLQPPGTPDGRAIEAAIAVPLQRRGSVDGVLEVLHLNRRFIDLGDVELLAAFAELAGGACRNADDHAAAQRAASLDSLTGCLNHATFQTRLREEISRCERGAAPFTLALVDLDGFKTINERFGHLAGDNVLRGAGEVLRQTVRLRDQVARFGGDEFALLLPATDLETARSVIDRPLKGLVEPPVPGAEPITASAGLAGWTWGDQATSIIERADAALRDAKRGRGADAGRPTLSTRRAVFGSGGDRSGASLRERPDVRARRMATAGEMGARLARLLDPQAIAETAVSDLHGVLGFEHCAIVRLQDGVALQLASAGDEGAGSQGLPQLSRAESPVGRSLSERRPVLVNDGDRDPVYGGTLGEGVRSELAVPLYVGSELWGAIDLRSTSLAAFEPDDAQLAQTVSDHIGAALRTASLYRELEQTYVGTASALAAALEAKDNYTADHARSIAELAVAVGAELGLDARMLRDLRYGAIFHDIGKIAVPDAILHKPGKLTAAEFEVVKRHPVAGEQILAPVPFLADVRRVVRHGHERWDGGGYPDGLQGLQIPVGARIVFAVDAYHAMTSNRPYRRGLPSAEAEMQLRAHAGAQFDPDVVAALLRVLESRRQASPTPPAHVSSGR